MLIKTKINLKKLFLLSPLATILALLFARNLTEIYVILAIYLATIANIFMLAEAVMELVSQSKFSSSGGDKKSKIMVLFAAKLLILIGALTLGVHFIGNRIIIPLLNYVIQIFILSLCFDRKVENS